MESSMIVLIVVVETIDFTGGMVESHSRPEFPWFFCKQAAESAVLEKFMVVTWQIWQLSSRTCHKVNFLLIKRY